VKSLIAIVLMIVAVVGAALFYCSSMPGQSPVSSSGALSAEEREIADRLKDQCEELGHRIGQRSTVKMQGVARAREYIAQRLTRSTLRPKEATFSSRGSMGVNLEAQLEGMGSKDEILVLGAHYDTAAYTPGGDDNASGVAMLIEMAHMLSTRPHDRTIQFVFFDRGSSRFVGSDASGSYAWADDAKKKGKKVVGMISIDSVGIYLTKSGTQSGPFPLSLSYPSTGNFLLFAGDFGSRSLVETSVQSFRAQGGFPCEGAVLPSFLPWLSHSDHFPFRQNGWPAMVVTDTGPMRNTEHGLMTDTPDRLDYESMAKATVRMGRVIEKLAQRNSTGTGSIN
jgi:hypothetical protein